MSFAVNAFSQTPFSALGDVSTLATGVAGTTALGSISAIASSAAQNLTGVGWVAGTLPKLYEKNGVIELPMADVAGGGIVTGSALMGSCLLYTSPSPRDGLLSRMPSSA